LSEIRSLLHHMRVPLEAFVALLDLFE